MAELTSDYAVEMVKPGSDVIAAGGDLAIRAAQQATKTISILGSTDDMVGSGLVTSMARPNGNTTGVSILATELDGKRQEILIEALPGLRQMACLADANTTAGAQLDALRAAARGRNIELTVHRIARGEEIAAAVNAAEASGATALNVLASPMLDAQTIMDRAAALRLPAIYQWPETAEEGCGSWRWWLPNGESPRADEQRTMFGRIFVHPHGDRRRSDARRIERGRGGSHSRRRAKDRHARLETGNP